MNHSQNRTLLITGANKGIGYAVVEKLISDPTPYNIIFTSRDETLGQKALETLKTKYPNSTSTLTYHQLNVTDNKSVEDFVAWFQKSIGKLDILINNAGIAYGTTDEERKNIVKTNYFSVIALTDKLLPFLSEDGKILDISSNLGRLSFQGETLTKILTDENLTREKLDKAAEDILEVIKDFKPFGPLVDGIYPASKALLNAYIRKFLPTQLKSGQQYYAVHPGWVKTDMGGANADITVEESAEGIVGLINLPFKIDDKLNGQLIFNKEILEY